MARTTGFVKRKGKILPKAFVIGLLGGALRGAGITLEGMLEQSGSDVSKVALHNRFDEEAVVFLAELLNCVSRTLHREATNGYRKVLGQFGRVLIYDGSAWDVSPRLASAFPGSGGSSSAGGCKLQLEYELKSGAISSHDLVPANVSDHSYAGQIVESAREGDLCLFDLGYVGYELLEELDENGAYFLCRLRAHATLTEKHGRKITLARMLKKARQRGNNQFEFVADLNDNGLEARIIATRLPERKRQERIAQLKKKKQKKGQVVSKACRELAGWCVYATNAEEQLLPTALASEIYRLRWSIELLFRQFKTTLKLDQATHANKHRLRCEVLAKLIASVITTSLHGQFQAESYRYRQQELSLQKVFQLLQRNTDSLLRALFRSVVTTKCFFRRLEQLIFRWCSKEYSRKKPSTFQRIITAATRRVRKHELFFHD